MMTKRFTLQQFRLGLLQLECIHMLHDLKSRTHLDVKFYQSILCQDKERITIHPLIFTDLCKAFTVSGRIEVLDNLLNRP